MDKLLPSESRTGFPVQSDYYPWVETGTLRKSTLLSPFFSVLKVYEGLTGFFTRLLRVCLIPVSVTLDVPSLGWTWSNPT